MSFQSTFKIKQNELVHGKGRNSGKNKTVYELADHVCKTHSYLCRISSLNEDLPFPSELLIPAMKFKQNFDCLQLMAWECGFAIVPLPKKVAMCKGDDNQMAADYQKSATDAVRALLDVIGDLSPETYQRFEKKFTHMVQDTLRVKKTIDKRATNQLELDL